MKLKQMLKNLKNSILALHKSNNRNPEKARRELVLNILLSLSIISFLIINLIRLKDIIGNPHDSGIPIIFTLLLLLFFIFLFFLSKKGKTSLASFLFIIFYLLPVIYSFLLWGADLPAALIMSILIVCLLGILISARWALIGAVLLNIFLLALSYLQENNVLAVDNSWRLEQHQLADAMVYASLIMIITSVILIFDNQIRKALAKAYQSEEELIKEKEMLEIRVRERTRAIREMEAEKITQLYRLAEFGRISSGIFHDLINPLTAISLNLEQLNCQQIDRLGNTKTCLTQAIKASNKMENLITSIKKSVKQENINKSFSFYEEVSGAISLINYQAKKYDIDIILKGDKKLSIYGDPLKFNQIISNLIINAIDACQASKNQSKKRVEISIKQKHNLAVIKVLDNGDGIKIENINKVFEPFFTTKDKKGLGLGLSSSKSILEKYFKGSIQVNRIKNEKTIFTIKIPLT